MRGPSGHNGPVTYPSYPYPPQYPPVARQPSAGTAITAVVLAYAAVGAAGIGLIYTVPLPSHYDAGPFWFAVVAVEVATLVLLGAGATMMLAGVTAGRWMVVAGCVVLITAVVVGSIILVVYAADAVESSSRSTAPDGDWSPVIAWGVGIVLAFLFATVVVPAALIAGLTLSSSTTSLRFSTL